VRLLLASRLRACPLTPVEPDHRGGTEREWL
jgi:hypothetical protein